MAPAQESSRAELLRRPTEEVPSPAEVYQRLAVLRTLRPVCGTRAPGEPAPADAAAKPHRAARAHVFPSRNASASTTETDPRTQARRKRTSCKPRPPEVRHGPGRSLLGRIPASVCLLTWGLSAFGSSTHFSFYHHPVTTAELTSIHIFPSLQDYQNVVPALALRPSVQSPWEMHSLPCAHRL